MTGEVRVLFNASKRAKSYQVQSSLDPNFSVITDYDPFSGSRNIILRGLPRAKDIWVRVRAIGPHHTNARVRREIEEVAGDTVMLCNSPDCIRITP